MARDRPSKDRPDRDSIPEDEDLPLLYPEDDENSVGGSKEELYDPFAEDVWNDPPTGKPAALRPEASAGSGTNPKRRGEEGERLHRLLDIESTGGDEPARGVGDAGASRGGGRDAAGVGGGSVFEPAGAAPTSRRGGTRRRRPRPRPAGPQAGQSGETVFQPRAAAEMDRPERGGTEDGLPEDPRDLPKVKPTYDRGREAGPIVITVVVLVVVGMVAWVDGTLIGLPLMLAGMAWGLYRLALVLPHPVRVTPEQAVREFYDAFCHRVPNYRRMYLLLSVPAKREKQINSYRAFCAYWRWRQAQIVGKNWIEAAGFDIERFDAKYNAQRTFAAVDFTLLLYRRGQPQSPVFVRPVSMTLVKGRDGSWYLNEGVLP